MASIQGNVPLPRARATAMAIGVTGVFALHTGIGWRRVENLSLKVIKAT